MASNVKERKARMDEGLHYYKPKAQTIEYTKKEFKIKAFFSPLFIVLKLCTSKCFFLINKIKLSRFAGIMVMF
jgi:hypothetical protein